jgi:hypothetical protein
MEYDDDDDDDISRYSQIFSTTDKRTLIAGIRQ